MAKKTITGPSEKEARPAQSTIKLFFLPGSITIRKVDQRKENGHAYRGIFKMIKMIISFKMFNNLRMCTNQHCFKLLQSKITRIEKNFGKVHNYSLKRKGFLIINIARKPLPTTEKNKPMTTSR